MLWYLILIRCNGNLSIVVQQTTRRADPCYNGDIHRTRNCPRNKMVHTRIWDALFSTDHPSSFLTLNITPVHYFQFTHSSFPFSTLFLCPPFSSLLLVFILFYPSPQYISRPSTFFFSSFSHPKTFPLLLSLSSYVSHWLFSLLSSSTYSYTHRNLILDIPALISTPFTSYCGLHDSSLKLNKTIYEKNFYEGSTSPPRGNIASKIDK